MRNVLLKELLQLLDRKANVNIVSEGASQDDEGEILYSGSVRDIPYLMCLDIGYAIVREIGAVDNDWLRVTVYCTGLKNC